MITFKNGGWHNDKLTVASGVLLLTWLWVMYVGSDVSWDVLNHHIYLPFSLLTGRFQTDLLAAGPQSLLNPIGYVPSYLLISANLPGWAVGTLLSLVHGLAVLPLISLAESVWGKESSNREWRWLAIGMAWASPIFLLTVGTSSTDPISNCLVLWTLSEALRPSPRKRPLLFSAAGLGLAVAIKPIAGIFALAIGTTLLARVVARQIPLSSLLSFSAATLVATAIFWGPWAAWVWMHFGNPIFPLYNDWFQSPFASNRPVVDRRFLPAGYAQWLLRPWQMAEMRRFVAVEAFAPDLRPAVLSVSVLISSLVGFWHATARGKRLTDTAFSFRATKQLALFSAIAFVLWMKSSGNARYVLPLMAVVGFLLVRSVQLLLPKPAARLLLLLILILQVSNYALQGEHRLRPRPWTNEPFLSLHVPTRLQQEPFLHLTIGLQSNAGVAPWLNRDGAMINAVGQMTIPSEGPLRDEFEQRTRKWNGKVRFLFPASSRTDEPTTPVKLRADRVTYHLGLRIDWTDCERIQVFGSSQVPPVESGSNYALLSCRAVTRSNDDPTYFRDRAQADLAFSALERRCPKVLAPPPLVSDAMPGEWQRRYANTDMRVTIFDNDEVVVSHQRSTNVVALGTVATIVAASDQANCPIKNALSPQ